MSQTEFKVQSASARNATQSVAGGKCKVKAGGFTLIEMMVAISILGIVAVIVSGFLLTTLNGSGKAEVNKEVRQNGSYALSVMEGLILNAINVGCTAPPPTIYITDINGQVATISCDTTNLKIASSSAAGSVDLTASNVAVSNCNFTCTPLTGGPTKVDILFTVSQKTSGLTPRPNETMSIDFQSEVITRNY